MAGFKDFSEDEKLKTAIDVLKAEFKPLRLFLFGSRADGTATEESDYDFVMVVRVCDSDQQLEYMRRAQRLLAHEGVPADVFAFSVESFEKRRHDFNSIPEVAFSTGREIDLHE